MSTDGHPKEVAEYPPGGGPGRVTATYSGGQLVTSPAPGPSPTTTEGNSTMPASDTTYTQQMSEYASLRRDAEEELNSATRKRMTSRLDILMSLGLDPASLAEAAAIDDALREQEKAARQALDATDAAIQGLSQRHGGIKAAVDDAPVDKPADAEFYADLQDRPETMGIFSSDDDKAFAAAIKVLLGKMPAHVRSEIMRDLDGETAATVRQALAASAAELRSGTRTCDSCRQGLHGSCAGQGCACG
jgi:hypothetical protein